ncbi:MAG: hypothetical protein CME63_13160 [Halobacteriovoraceae bacterium]|nr:hypothetical protein [Halobacteriovoraceae bacterium]MBC98692.1 hypothetical protein [Halobacteriovoraceae bacterium]|tara:strand:- start:1158 stop:1517 length:360 start_codon:yes stop_codon:yes gene_type:complete
MNKVILLIVAFVLGSSIYAGDAKKGAKVFKKINCALCHKADGMGKAKNGKLSILKAPRIAGLSEKYIIEQVTAIQSKKRKTAYTSMMYSKVRKLSKQDIADVAAYVSGLSKDKHKGMKE